MAKANDSNHPLLKDLNGPQREAVLHQGGPLLVLAGAGSGKTRVIAHRIAYLISQGVRPHQILAVTFTNKAAEEMRSRVENLLGTRALGMWLSTFHSACVRILRKFIAELGYPSTFVIYDEHDRLTLVKECLKDLEFSEKILNPHSVVARISSAKNQLLGPEEFANLSGDFFEERVSKLYYLYQERLRKYNALDFDDLLMLTALLLQNHSQVLEHYHRTFQYILVDEYQDTNHAQYRLVHLLAQARRNLVVVGDEDQSIYRWRGADLRNILDFQQDFPDARVIRLEQNYRSTKKIITAAGAVIAHNLGRLGKELWTNNPEGDHLHYLQVEDEGEEAHLLASLVSRLTQEDGYNYRDFAVLYRTNAQSRVLEDGFRQRSLPYTIVGGVRFYERKEIKNILAYLKLTLNPTDDMAFKRAVMAPLRGVGKTTLEKLAGLARAHEVSLLTACGDPLLKDMVPSRQYNALTGFRQFILTWQEKIQDLDASEVVEALIKNSGLQAALEAENTPEARSRLENLGELISAAVEFEEESEDKTLAAFLDNVSLVSDIDTWDPAQGAVTLMTLHSAKGLEFPVVFITGLEEGIFPHAKSVNDEAELEEERRLCYVGMTRAKEKLFLTSTVRRKLYGTDTWNIPSRFLEEIPEEYMIKKELVAGTESRGMARHAPTGKAAFFAYDESQEAPLVDQYHIGQRVVHPQWGKGVILKRLGVGEDLKLIIDFTSVGQKKLAAKYASLEKAP
jgi:DNA helicase-2/ATP-dependent DNA helicase PcrA